MTAEIEGSYAHRWAVPRDVWHRLFSQAKEEIGILAHSGLFLAEDDELLRVLADKAHAGIPVRILLGDPDNSRVAERGVDEGVDETMAERIRNSIALYGSLRDVDGVEIRLHQTILYASLYRADDDLFVNPHAYGVAASQAPVLHVRHTTPGDVAGLYVESFERVWGSARPLT